MEHPLFGAFRAATDDRLAEWAIEFLEGPGANAKLAHHIRNRPTASVRLLLESLDVYRRVMGPEPGMTFTEPRELWEQRVSAFMDAIASGTRLPPLIATDFWEGQHTIADGAHRYEALLRTGWTSYWVLEFSLRQS